MDKSCTICQFLKEPLHPIIRTKYWNVELGTNQAYIGRAYVTLLDHKGRLSDLTHEEWRDFEELVGKLEVAYLKGLGAEPINWSCLMNNAYQEEPYNPHVHWHLIPRYQKPVQIGDLVFRDEEYGHMFAPRKERSIDESVLSTISDRIKAYL